MADSTLGICQVCMGVHNIERPAEHIVRLWCEDGSVAGFRMCASHWSVWLRILLARVLEPLKAHVHLGSDQWESADRIH